ncbi:uncharacterized protein B0H64DRAFT_398842 [Chaetomium fimeti]|uniref:Uncharacterized protein n=1 Tax=Chaetomium fimeti TaxID=1854472 RepID=A0AAE0HC52_9PEZI|nr:hypothetical protein B0H64DRAFT_398842 [Chaetomium fimeti]
MSTNNGSLDEFTSKPIFWVLGFLTIVSYIVTIRNEIAVNRYRATLISYDAETIMILAFFSNIRWLIPYTTSRPRKLLFAFLYLGVFGMHVLMLRWVGITGWRWIIKVTFDFWPAQGHWLRQLEDYFDFLVLTLILFFIVVSAVCLGVVMACFQLTCVYELITYEPDVGRKEK